MDKVTIITVAYNAKATIEETILSVIRQSYENIEYIVIDGASADGTVDIIKRYEDKIDYWVSEPDDGIYHAMNKGITKATGEWINFMNAGDTFYDNDTIAHIMTHKKDDADLIYGNHKIKGDKREKHALSYEKCLYTMPLCHQALFTKSQLMKKVQFNTCFNISADYDFIVKMYLQEKKFQQINRTIVVFEPGGFATSHQLLRDTEAIKILCNHKISPSIIKQSIWYKNLQKRSLFYKALKYIAKPFIIKIKNFYEKRSF